MIDILIDELKELMLAIAISSLVVVPLAIFS